MKLSIIDAFGHNTELEFHPWTLIKTVKDKLQELLHIKAVNQRLFFNNTELKNKRTLIDCSITDGSILFLATINPSKQTSLSLENCIQIYANVPAPNHFRDQIILPAQQGLALGLKPKLSEEGTGGTYFLRNRKKQNVAVFKAEDEEPFAPNNPRGYVGLMNSPGFRKGILSGEGAIREVAAYLLDSKGFFGIPATTRVEIAKQAFDSHSNPSSKRGTGLNFAASGKLSDPGFTNSISLSSSDSRTSNNFLNVNSPTSLTHSFSSNSLSNAKRSPSLDFPAIRMSSSAQASKIGALQEWVDFDDFAGDLACQQFPVKEVHKIAILDIRMFNLDRNEANILVKKRWPSPTASSNSNGEIGTPLPSPALGFDIDSSNSSTGSPLDLSAPVSASSLHNLHHEHNQLHLPPSVLQEKNATNPTPNYNNNHSPLFNLGPDKGVNISPITTSNSSTSSLPAGMSRLQARMQAMKSLRASSKPILTLTPIDHSLTLPDTLELAYTDWCWLEWPQVKQPLDEECRKFVMDLDPKADIQLLRSHLPIREPCLRVMRISSMLLQKGISAGLTLYQIAMIMCRNNLEQPSDLEIMCAQAQAIARQKLEGRKFSINHRQQKSNKPRDHKNGLELSPEISPEHNSNGNHIETLQLDAPKSSSNNSNSGPITSSVSGENSNNNANNRRDSSSDISDLPLRRSISHHDFRGFKVSERGFGLSNLVTSNSKQSSKLRNGCKHLDDDPELEHIYNQANSNNTTPIPNSTSENKLLAATVQHNPEQNARNISGNLTEEQQNELFFSCLSSLIDSTIERVLAKEKLILQQQVQARAQSEIINSSNSAPTKSLETQTPLASPNEVNVPALTRSRSLLQTISSPPTVPANPTSIFKGLTGSANNTSTNNISTSDSSNAPSSVNVKFSGDHSPVFPLSSPPSSEYNSLGFPLHPQMSPPAHDSFIPDADSLSSSRLSSEETNLLGTTSESSSISTSYILSEFEPPLSTDSLRRVSEFSLSFLNPNKDSNLEFNSNQNNNNVNNSNPSSNNVKTMNFPATSTAPITISPNSAA